VKNGKKGREGEGWEKREKEGKGKGEGKGEKNFCCHSSFQK